MPGKKLLVADDSLTIQKVIRLALSNEGYEIQAVSDGNDAVQQISLFRPDVVLIDVSLPGKSAFEVKRETNQHDDLEEVRYVLMSSAFESVDEVQSNEVAFHGNLTKPFDPAHLRQVLSDVLAQVTTKRMEKTSILMRPNAESVPPVSPGPRPTEDLSIFPPPIEHTGEIPILPFAPSEPIIDLWEPSPENMEIRQENEGPEVPPYSETRTSSRISAYPDFTPPTPSPFPPPSSPFIAPPSPFAPVESPFETPPDEEQDIKQLADSTLRISGLDDYQWSVKEPSYREAPVKSGIALKPPPGVMDHGNSTFKVEPPEGMRLNPEMPPPFSEHPIFLEEEENEVQIEYSSYSNTHILSDNYEIPAASSTPEFTPPPTPTPSFSQAQVEELVKQQVSEALEKMTQKLLPEIAERIIKAEIHKMLSE